MTTEQIENNIDGLKTAMTTTQIECKIDGLKTALAEIATLRASLRARTMHYQYELKCEVAKSLCLTFEQVNLPYAEWAEIRGKWLAERSHPHRRG